MQRARNKCEDNEYLIWLALFFSSFIFEFPVQVVPEMYPLILSKINELFNKMMSFFIHVK